MKVKNCPRCGSSEIQHGRVKGKCGMQTYIRCADCEFKIHGSSGENVINKWNTSKESRTDYVLRMLDNYGNAFISEQLKELWDGYDLASYLSEKFKKPVHIRPCSYIKNGCVAEVG